MNGRIQKLEALLARVQRNRTAAPVRAFARDSLPASPVPPAVVSARPSAPVSAFSARPTSVSAAPPQATPPGPPVAPPPVIAAPMAVAPPPFLTEPQPVTPPTPVVSERPAALEPLSEPPPVTTPSWQPEPGSAVQSRPASVPPVVELNDDDLLEVSTLPPAAEEDEAPSTDAEPNARDRASEIEADADIDVDVSVDEQAPASSSRFKVPGMLDDTGTLDEPGTLEDVGVSPGEHERDIPAKTPPPESGPQEALPAIGLEASRIPDVSELEADLSGPPSMGPTAEQLGETIELDAPRGPALEIDVSVVGESEPAPAPEELEMTLPRPSLPSGLYDVAISAAPPEQVLTLEAPAGPTVHEQVTLAPPVRDEPERMARPALGATDVASVTLAAASAPKTFVELLDASLGL